MATTSVRVALRVRPLTEKERLSNCSDSLTFIPNEPQVLIGTDKSFTYDHVFDSQVTQETVYSAAALPLLHKFIDGFNSTILAYGQTGSGKTYSMGTSLDQSNDETLLGIVPRCIRDLFQLLDERVQKDSSYEYEVYVSFLELYNEELIDLLNPQITSQAQKRRSTGSISSVGSVSAHGLNGGSDITIREDPAGGIYWSGVREERCYHPKDLLRHLVKGSLYRTTGSTDMNTVSSRSHAIFSVLLKQHCSQTSTDQDEEPLQTQQPSTKTVTSKFHFVDLAGSERLKRTNAQGDRAKEGIAINSGLLALGNVISALGDEQRRASHIPYRDSKLTRLLQDSLGGNSQTLMLACVSSSDSNFMETLNTLKYANRARNIKNKVMVNQDFAGNSIEVNQLRSLVARLRMEISGLRHRDIPSTFASGQNDTRALVTEISRLRTRLDETTTAMVQLTSERDTLLVEREIGQVLSSHNAAEPAVQHHPIILRYQKTIHELTQELADTRDRLSFLETSRLDSHAIALAHATPSTSRHIASPHTPTRSLSQRRTKHVVRRRRPLRPTVTSNLSFTSRKSTTPRGNSLSNPSVPMRLLTNQDEDEDEGFVHGDDDVKEDTKGNDVIRHQVKESIAKVKADIQKGMELLELIKPLDDVSTSWEEESKTSERDTSDNNHQLEELDTLQPLDVPAWDSIQINHITEVIDTPSTPIVDETKSMPIVPGKDPRINSQLTRMLQQIQSDIRVKEELVSHLEKSETEYTFMRRKFDDKITQLQAQLLALQKERDNVLQRSQHRYSSQYGSSTQPIDAAQQQRERQQLSDIRQSYETKMKSLQVEINGLRRRYTQTTAEMQTTRNQSNSLLKSLRTNVDTLKGEKKRMLKRMQSETERVREQMANQERRIQQLQRQQHETSQAKRRLEREHEAQKEKLKKRSEEAVLNNSQLKQLIAVLKKAVREDGMLDENLLRKVSHIVGGHFAVLVRGGFRHPGRRSGKSHPIPAALRARKKKQLLDRALYQFVQGKQALVEMEQLLVRRQRLADEKADAIDERQRIYETEKAAAVAQGRPMDTSALDLADERIDMIITEIAYLTRRIQAIQAEAASGSGDDGNVPIVRPEKHVTFADEIVDDPLPSDEWADMDVVEEQFTVPSRAAPEEAYDITMRLLRSLEPDEGKHIAETLANDIMAIRISECDRQVSMQSLEKTVQDLRRTLVVMKRAAIATTIENERRIRRLEEHSSGDRDDVLRATDAKMEEYISSGNTIFDKIYEDGLRGLITTSPDLSSPRSVISSPGDDLSEDHPVPSAAHRPPGPQAPTQSFNIADREETPSPDRFLHMIQKRLSQTPSTTTVLGIETPLPLPVSLINPAEYAKYTTDPDSSTSTLRSSHFRRPSIQSSDASSSISQASFTPSLTGGVMRQRALSLQRSPHVPIPPSIHHRRQCPRIFAPPPSKDFTLSPLVTASCQPRPPPTLPLERPHSHVSVARPPSRDERATTPSVFDRLAQTPTRASRAKMQQYRHSSGCVEDLKHRWQSDQRPSSVLGNYSPPSPSSLL